MITTLIWLMGFQLLGEVLVRLLGVPVPGAVAGMLLLFLVLCLRESVPRDLQRDVPALLRHLSLLFVPAGVGIVAWRSALVQAGPGLFVVLPLAVLVTMASGAWLLSRLLARSAA